MSFNTSLVNTYIVKTFNLDTGVATRVWTFQAPTFPTALIALDVVTAASDSTDKPTAKVTVNSDDRITGTAVTAPNVVQHNITVDSGKSLSVPADATMSVTVTCAGTAANVRGISVTVVSTSGALYPAR